MANVNRPGGLKPVRYLNGASYNGQANLYYIGAGEAALYVGDPVTFSGTADTRGVPGISIGVAGSAILGVIVGFVVAPAGVSLVGTTIDLTRRSNAASTAGYALVCDDPNVIFEIQDGFTVPAAATEIGYNCNFLIAAGATTYSDSGTVTEATAAANTATLNLKIIGLAQREDNAFGAYAKLLVLINNHIFKGYSGTTGV